MQPQRGYSLLDLFITCAVVFTVILVLLIMVGNIRHTSRDYSCKNTQRQLVLGLITYRDGSGLGIDFPRADGGEFLRLLYTTEEISEPSLFLCGMSGDRNDMGALMLQPGPLAPHAISFAGRRNRNQNDYPGIYTNKGATETPVISDDSEGSTGFNNHWNAVNVAFVDGHVEEMNLSDPRLKGAKAVGEGLLDPLAN